MPHNTIGTDKEWWWQAYVRAVREGEIEQPDLDASPFVRECWQRALDAIAIEA